MECGEDQQHDDSHGSKDQGAVAVECGYFEIAQGRRVVDMVCVRFQQQDLFGDEACE